MVSDEVQRTPTLETNWKDLTDRHRERRERVEQNIAQFPKPGTQASYVIGAIGAGKTQLLTHLYKYSYTEVGHPAVFVSMGQLLDEVDERIASSDEGDSISQEEFYHIVETIATDALNDIHQTLESGDELSQDLALLDSSRISDPARYAETLGISSEEFSEITTRSDRITLIIDEMEESYARLEELVRSTTGPLRDVVDRIESGNSSFYLIGGFGYASVHELGEAEYRRIDPVILPIIKPDNVADVLGSETSPELRNFVWWMSRGRPGWLETAEQAHELHSGDVSGTYDTLGDIPNLAMSRVNIVALDDLEEYCKDLDQLGRNITAYTIFEPRPTQIKNITASLSHEELTQSSAHAQIANSLTSYEKVVDAFLKGAQSVDNYHDTRVSDQVIRRFLVRILESITDANGDLVFGAVSTPMFRRGHKCHQEMLSPLAERVHDLALEEAGDGHQETIDFLYELSQTIASTKPEDISTVFGEFFDLFTTGEELTDTGYVGPSIGTLITTFPSLITNPRLSFAGAGRTESEQFSELVENLTNGGSGPERLRELGSLMQEDSR